MPQRHEDTKSIREYFKITILLFLIFGNDNTFSQTKYWEYLTETEQNEFLKNTPVSTIAIDYFKGKFKAADDSLTFELLDTLTESRDYNPFYFYLFNKISMSTDGALAEVIPAYSYLFFRSHPAEEIGYFTLERMQHSNHEKIERYAKIFGWAFRDYGFVDEENKVNYIDFKKFLKGKLVDLDIEDMKTLEIFLNEVEKVMKSK